MKKLDVNKLARDLRSFKAITRKSILSELMGIVGTSSLEDAGFVEMGEYVAVISCDGIIEEIVKEDPRLAGYYSVLVNVGDVAAKGAKPMGFLCMVSSPSNRIRMEICEGVKEGLDKYGLSFLKGHAQPDSTYSAVDGACVGLTKRVLRSDTAREGESIVFACDLEGTFSEGKSLNTFESTKHRNRAEIQKQIGGLVRIAEEQLASAAKDVGGPGIVGSTTMLCEYSRVGAVVNLEKIPRPSGVDMEKWLFTYPSTGYILTTGKVEECIRVLSDHGLQASVIGEVISDKRVILKCQREYATFMDLDQESIFGFSR